MLQRIFRLIACVAVALGVMLPATVASAEPTTEQQLDKAYDELEHVIEDFNRIGEELKAAQAAAADIEQKLGGLQARVDATQGEVGKFAVTAYKGGGNLSATRFLLDADDSASMARQVAAMERVSRSRQRDIAGFAAGEDAVRGREEAAGRPDRRADPAARGPRRQEGGHRGRDQAAGADRGRHAATRGRPRRRRPVRRTRLRRATAARARSPSQFAYAQLGKMYLYGAAGPDRFDCSGLTQQAWKRAGVNLPHNAAQQHQRTSKVTRAAAAAG